MKKLFAIILILCFTITAFSQAVLLSKTDPSDTYKETKWGPNKRHFGHWFVNYGLPIPTSSENNSLHTFRSGTWNLGYAYKIKVLKFMDIGLDASYSNHFYTYYYNKYSDGKTSKLRTYQNGIKGNMYLRFHLNAHRGNFFGWYVDLGFYADSHIQSGIKEKAKEPRQKKYKTKTRDDDRFTPLTYGPTFALGFNQYSIFAQYNLEEVLTNKEYINGSNMPQLIIGIKLNLYSN